MLGGWFGASSDASATDAAAQQFVQFHALARDMLERALQYDEKGAKAEARLHYQKALEVIRVRHIMGHAMASSSSLPLNAGRVASQAKRKRQAEDPREGGG